VWTFPSILLSAFLVAWGAEAAQFLISQGLALAILAWLQTLPEFAVEAVIAWEAGRDPERAHLAIANLTGAIRLLLGLGWPMIYFVFAFSGRREARLPRIKLEPEHAVEVMGLVPPLLYFLVVLWRQRIGAIDATVLIALYVAYLWVLMRNPPREAESFAEARRCRAGHTVSPAGTEGGDRRTVRGRRRAAVPDRAPVPRVDDASPRRWESASSSWCNGSRRFSQSFRSSCRRLAGPAA
jgi:cation:H+ antiporter